jgi:hypothetical protein
MRFSVGVLIVAITHGCGGEKPASTATTGSGDLPANVSVPPVPALTDGSAAEARSTSDSAFLAEPRDDAWAPGVEAELAKRFRSIRGGKLGDLECRKSQCRLVIAGSQGDVGQTIADLEGHRGLHGYAKTVVLGRPTKKPDGSVELPIYTVFER